MMYKNKKDFFSSNLEKKKNSLVKIEFFLYMKKVRFYFLIIKSINYRLASVFVKTLRIEISQFIKQKVSTILLVYYLFCFTFCFAKCTGLNHNWTYSKLLHTRVTNT